MDIPVSNKSISFPGRGRPVWLADPAGLAHRMAVPPMQPRFPWIGGDMQTLRNALMPRPGFDRGRARRLIVPVGNGDGLSVLYVPGRQAQAAIVLIHGLGGDENGAYMKSAARSFQARGYDVYLLNLRGAGPSARTSRGIYNAGLSDDVNRALSAIAGRTGLPLFAYGVSLGGGLLAKAMGEAGKATPVRAGISVSSPLDLKRTSDRLLAVRNRIYQAYLTRKLGALLSGAQVDWSRLDRQAAGGLRTVYDFDRHVICPLFGYPAPEDYYEDASCGPTLPGIQIPFLFIQAADDPWLPVEQDIVAGITGRWVHFLLAPSGGHVGFHARGSAIPWHERVAASFYESLLT